MQILNFIVIDGSLRSFRDGKGYAFTLSGENYIPLATPIPIIQKGHGCVGIGMVEELNITQTSTTIYFKAEEVSDNSAKAYYNLYRNQISVSSNTDYSGQEDTLIPGMARGIRPSVNINDNSIKDKKSRRENTHKSLMDYDELSEW